MAESVPFREKYGSRFVVNAALLTVVSALSWLWFTAHVKPHTSILIFGGVSVATFVGVAAAVFSCFFEKGEAMGAITRLLKAKKLTPALIAALPVLLFAYLTTFTLYLTSSETSDVRLNVKRGSSVTAVVLTPAEKQKAVSYFFAFRPVTAHIETIAPNGFQPRDLPLRRGIPSQLTVPDPASQKTFHLVRLMPLDNLFHLRGRRDPDPQYVVHLFVPGRPPIEHAGLGFHAIYLGASAADLRAQAKSGRNAIAELKDRLGALDIPADQIEQIVAEWLDNPEVVETPELKPGDRVRVVVESPKGKTETTVKVGAQMQNVFLEGAEP